MQKDFSVDVNTRWMEALDVGSGRLYFVRLETNAAGDARPGIAAGGHDAFGGVPAADPSQKTAAPALRVKLSGPGPEPAPRTRES